MMHVLIELDHCFATLLRTGTHVTRVWHLREFSVAMPLVPPPTEYYGIPCGTTEQQMDTDDRTPWPVQRRSE